MPFNTPVKRLVNALKAVEALEDVKCSRTGMTAYISDKRPEIDRAVNIADDVLITKTGDVDRVNIARLKQEGYSVYPGECDSFGWLTGCIRTKVGILVFG